jgi:hypothetical protein
MQSRLDDAVDDARGEWNQRRQQPQPPPDRPALAADQLVSAETAEAIEGPSDAAAVSTLVKLKPAVAAASILGMIHDHGRLIASRTKARRNQSQWR